MINIKRFIKENADSSYSDFNKKFIDSKYPIVGVRIPVLKKFAKEIEPEYIELDSNPTHEEILLYGFSASNFKTESEQLEYLTNIIPFIDNWCTCDCIVCALKKLNKSQSYDFFTNLLKSSNQFEIRVGIVGLMRYFLKTDKLDDILKNIFLIKNEEYYVKMAIAWFYAEVCIFNFEKGMSQISLTEDKFIRNKAITKARESFRVSKENKDILNKLKK